MKMKYALVIACAVMVLVATGGIAQVENEWGALTDEEKQVVMETMNQKWMDLTPEQREAARAKAREKWNSLTPE